MQLPARIQLKSILKQDGVVLVMLNLALAFVCAIAFVGVLAVTVFLSVWFQSYTGNPRLSVPFPWYVLLLLYVIAFVLIWMRFARRLQPRSISRAIRTGLAGATPLFGLSLLGFLGVAWTLVTGDFGPDSMLEAAVFVYGILSTLILLAGITCTGIVTLFTPRPYPQ